MTAGVFGLFGYWGLGKRTESLPDRGRPVARSEYADALSAGWVSPPPEIPVKTVAVIQTYGQEVDAEEFLSRVYLYQQC